MRYSKSDSEYFRNKKGGGLETNGELNSENFRRKNLNNNLREINHRKNKNTFELPEMNSSGKYKIKPIKIMVKKKSLLNFFNPNEHYIFFGINPDTGIYEYVIYVNKDFSQLNTSGTPIICKKREEDGTIVELTHHDFLNINVKELSILVYHLLLIRKKNNDFIDEKFFIYLYQFVIPIILHAEIHNKNYIDIVDKIKKILPKRNNNVNNNPALPPRRTKQ